MVSNSLKKRLPRASVADFFYELAGDAWERRVLRSPPDVFALAASVLARSGAYLAVVSQWPPKTSKGSWQDKVRHIATEWRSLSSQSTKPPLQVRKLWQVIVNDSRVSMKHLSELDHSKAANVPRSKAARLCRNL